MKLSPLVLLIAGLTTLGVQRYLEFHPETLPLPGNGLTVRMAAAVKSSGDYYLVVSLPKADESNALGPDSFQCSFTFTATSARATPIEGRVARLDRYAEIGFSNVQLYKSQSWHLDARAYQVSIRADAPCDAASLRGAAVSMERDASQVTERFLGHMLILIIGMTAAGAGLIGLVVREVRKR
jgi:hypothetical protein